MTTEPPSVETTTDDPADQQPAHGLVWGVKASFVDYLRRMPDGRGAIGTTQLWTGSEVELTQQGTEIFNDVYPVGEPFEPIMVQLPEPA